MNIDVVDVRLDERKLPYLVSETVAEYRGEYVGEQRLKVNSPEKVVNVLNNVFHMKDFSEEKLYVMFLSASLHVIAYAEVSHRVIDSATVGIREIMQRAFLTNAAGIILAHNHPGLGSTANPSTQDIDVTQGLMRACEIMGIHMFDHIIVAGDDYYSFREKHAELYVKREESRKKDAGCQTVRQRTSWMDCNGGKLRHGRRTSVDKCRRYAGTSGILYPCHCERSEG